MDVRALKKERDTMPLNRQQFNIAATAAISAAALPISTVAAGLPAASLPERLSDAFIELFGNHPGFREIHAKGIVCEGSWEPYAAASTVSRAPHFLNRAAVTVRFSDFAGIPTISSTDPNASPHGMAIKFHVANADTDIVAHSVNAFPAATGEGFLEFILALAKSPPGAVKPTVIERYLKTHPAAMYFVKSMPPPPQSFATSAYHAINALKFTNAAGQVVYGRYHILPQAGVIALDPNLTATRSRDYLAEELRTRLQKNPAVFTLALQIAAPEDPTNDGTYLWPADRRFVELGQVRLTHAVTDSLAAQRALLYDPTRLIDGIELSDDPLPAVRTATYAISFARRSRNQ
jgi:catalase